MKFSSIFLSAGLYLISSISSIEAGISTNTPFKSVTWNGGEDVKVVWSDDGTAPALADIGNTTVDLMNGDATKQVFVSNIGNALATAKELPYTVPKDVGPPSDSYFIKYTAGNYSAFSGMFSIANVNGKLMTADPAGNAKAKTADPKAADPKTVDPKAKTKGTTSDPPKTGDTPKTGGTKAINA